MQVGGGLQEGQISPEPGHRRPQVKWNLLLLTTLNINNGEIDEIPSFITKALFSSGAGLPEAKHVC